MRKVLLIGTVVSALAGLALTATPSHAAAGDTLVTFTVGTVGTTVSLVAGTYVPGTGSATTAVGTIVGTVVTDLRTTPTSWAASVSSTDFGLVGATAQTGTALVPATAAKIWTPTTVVTVPGTAAITNTHTALGSALSLANTSAPLLSAVTTNANITTFTSNLQMDVTTNATGVYTGTVTQTVS